MYNISENLYYTLACHMPPEHLLSTFGVKYETHINNENNKKMKLIGYFRKTTIYKSEIFC